MNCHYLIAKLMSFALGLKNGVISNSAAKKNQAKTFTITDTKLYVSVETLSTQDNAKLLEILKSGFKRKINWNKWNSKITSQNAPNS